MKICICVCLSKKNNQFNFHTINSLKRLYIPNNFNLELAFVLPTNFFFIKEFILKNLTNKNFKVNFLNINKGGIPYSRNKFLSFARKKNYRYLAFIDDDCLIDRRWLFEMIKLMKSKNPDIIGGPQNHKVEESRIKNYFYMNEPRHKHQEKIRWAATNNVFFKSKIIETNKIKFNTKLDKIGGSDQLFFHFFWSKGYNLIWNNKSLVTEYVPNERKKISWFLKRNFRYGYSGCFIDLELKNFFLGVLVNLFKVTAYIFISFISMSLFFTKNKKATSFFYLARLSGRVYALLGFKIKKYF